MAAHQFIPIPPNVKDLTGLRSGRWTVVGHIGMIRPKFRAWLCRCDCGTERNVKTVELTSGRSKSCGCRKSILIADGGQAKHGQSYAPDFQVWKGMIARCHNPKSKDFRNYGGRGITVCDRWRESPQAFFDDMGPRPTPRHSIDRFPDNDGNYEPGNCRWATTKEQASNRRSSRHIEHEGVTRTLSEWAEHVGLRIDTLHQRLGLGWDFARSIGTPAWDETGARNNVRKLTREKVTEIRRLHAAGRSMRSLAQEFGVSCPSIRKIIRRESWATI